MLCVVMDTIYCLMTGKDHLNMNDHHVNDLHWHLNTLVFCDFFLEQNCNFKSMIFSCDFIAAHQCN